MLTLSLTTPTLLVEQGFAGFSAAVSGNAATPRQPLCTMLFPRSSGFDSPPSVGQTFAETRCLQEPAPCSGYPGAILFRFRSVQVSGMAGLPQRAAWPPQIERPHAYSEFRRVS
jgi:hypothetical protein